MADICWDSRACKHRAMGVRQTGSIENSTGRIKLEIAGQASPANPKLPAIKTTAFRTTHPFPEHPGNVAAVEKDVSVEIERRTKRVGCGKKFDRPRGTAA